MKTPLRDRGFKFYLTLTNLRTNKDSLIVATIQRFVVFFCVCAHTFDMVAMYYAGWEKTLQTTAFYGAIGTMTTVQQVYFTFKQRSVNRLLEAFEELQYKQKDGFQKDIFQREFKKAWDIVDLYTLYLFSFCIFYLTIPIVIEIIVSMIYPGFPVIPIPQPCQGFIDLVEPHTAEHYALLTIDTLWSVLSIPSHTGFQCSLVIAIIYTRLEMKIISEKIGEFKKRYDSGEKELIRTKNNYFRDIITHHQSVLRIHELLNDLYGFPSAMQNLIISIIFCLNLYMISNVKAGEDIFPAVQGVFSLLVVGYILLYHCSLGESLQTQNEELVQYLYDLPWAFEEVSFGRDVHLMVKQAHRPYAINYCGLSSLNLNLFMQIANTAYSYFMMITSTN